MPKYPQEWLERVPGEIFACLIPGEIRIILFPGAGLADGGAHTDVAIEFVPVDLRTPSTPIWVQLSEQAGSGLEIVRVWRRDSSETASAT